MKRPTRCNVAHPHPISQRANGPNRANRDTGNTRNRDTGFITQNCTEIDSYPVTGNTGTGTGASATGLGDYHAQECQQNKAEAAALVSACHAVLAEAQAIFAAKPNAVSGAYLAECRAMLAKAQHTYREASRIYADALIQLGALVALQGGHSPLSQLSQPRKHSIQRRTARAVRHQERQYTQVAHYTCQGCGHEWDEPLDSEGGTTW